MMNVFAISADQLPTDEENRGVEIQNREPGEVPGFLVISKEEMLLIV